MAASLGLHTTLANHLGRPLVSAVAPMFEFECTNTRLLIVLQQVSCVTCLNCT